MSQRNLPLDYLKTAVVVFAVVAHHSILAYAVLGQVQFDTVNYLENRVPVMDPMRWLGFDAIASFNDKYMMSLMFFVSGLFVWASLKRKGSKVFLRDRVLRLGVPFAVAVLLLMPLAYYPSFLMTGSGLGPASFFQHYYSLAEWSPGPVWFIWVLLAFNCALIAILALVPGAVTALGHIGSVAQRRPIAFFVALVAWSSIAFVLTTLAFRPDEASRFGFGPFKVQVSRLPLYATYFLAAVGVGIHGVERGLLARDGLLARRWALWLLGGVGSWVLYQVLVAVFPWAETDRGPLLPTLALGVVLALTVASLTFGLLGLFLRFVNRPSVIFESLQRNAFGIYIIHYIFVTWTQYALLSAPLPAVAKAGIVFVVALAFSWAVTDAIRRIPAVGRYL